MLSKKFRLSRKEIETIHKNGRRLNAAGLSIKCLANNLDYSRFAVNVPVKVSKKATVRNRLRRIVYDEIGKAKPAGNLDCLIGIYRLGDEAVLRQKVKQICANL
jgi:ribonuclease P protein component